jgi:hypothetical protein
MWHVNRRFAACLRDHPAADLEHLLGVGQGDLLDPPPTKELRPVSHRQLQLRRAWSMHTPPHPSITRPVKGSQPHGARSTTRPDLPSPVMCPASIARMHGALRPVSILGDSLR